MTSPRWARALVHRWVDRRLRDAVLGDLDELFAFERAALPVRAYVRYWQRTFGVLFQVGICSSGRK